MNARAKDPRFDAEGFLRDPEAWSAGLATEIAAAEGMRDLGQDHIRVLEELRHRYLDRGDVPAMRHVCRDAGFEESCVRELLVNPLRAWRIAGLPDPGEEAKAYLEVAQ